MYQNGYRYQVRVTNSSGSVTSTSATLVVMGSTTGATIYVSTNGAQVSPYDTLANATRSIQTAVDLATDGDQVVVAPGTYTLSAEISVTKGITVRSSGGATVTIVDGNNAVRGFSISHADAIVDGFTITHGYNNTYGGWGGGVTFGDIFTPSAGGQVRNCIIKNNNGGQYGGGVYLNGAGILRNCLIINNQASINYGGGVALWKGGVVENCTISGNSAYRGGGLMAISDSNGITPQIRNTIIYGNSASYQYADANISQSWGGGTYTNNCTSTNSSDVPLPGTGNITSDPLFVNAAAGDYHLQASSPCRDTGGNLAWSSTSVDLDGQPRIHNDTVDMGAYEYSIPDVGPVITSQPASATVTVNTGAIFSVTAVGTGTLTYQWNKDGAAIDGATSATLTLSAIQSTDAGSYTVVVTDTEGSTTSHAAMLTVNRLPQTITFAALPVKSVNDAPFTLSATASSSLKVTYASSNTAVATVSGDTVTITGVGTTTITASQSGSTIYQAAADAGQSLLVVGVLPVISNQPVSPTVNAGQNTTITVAASGIPSPTFQWQVSTDAGVSWNHLANDSTYSGVTTATLTITAVSAGQNGYRYRAMVTNSGGSVVSNAVTLLVNTVGATLYVSPNGGEVAPYDTLANAARSIQTAVDQAIDGDQVVVAPGTYTLAATVTITKGITVRGSGGAAVTIVDGNNAVRGFSISHANAIVDGFTITHGYDAYSGGGVAFGNLWTPSAGGMVRNCIIRNNNGSMYGGGVWIYGAGTVRNCLIIHNQASINYGGGIGASKGGVIENCTISANSAYRGGGIMAVSDTGGNAPQIRNTIVYGNSASSEYADANLSWSYGGGTYTNNCASTNSSSAPLPGTGNITSDPLFVDPAADDYHLQAGSPCTDAGTNLDWTAAAVDLDGQPRVENNTVDIGAYEYSASANAGPVITSQPANQTVSLGDNATFTVTATGTGTLSYLWSHDGVALAGATGATCTITGAQVADAGTYAVVVSDDLGNVTSNAAILTVAQRTQTITFTGPTDQAFTSNPITLTASVSSNLAVTFVLDSGPATLNGNVLTLTGAGVVVIHASQGGDAAYLAAPDVYQSFTVTTDLDSWRQNQFTAPEIADDAISGPTADPDHDGFTNLLEYALGLNPKAANEAGRPETAATATNWTYTFTRPTDRPDLTYTVEVSTDLIHWTATGVSLNRTATAPGSETWQATYPTTSTPTLFFRLKVDSP